VGFFAARLHGAPGSVVLGALAGIAFGAAAVASRPLANLHSFERFIADPLLYLLIAHSVVGQLLLGLAMQRGSTTAAVAAMDAAAAVPAAIVGLLFLGDRVTGGLEWLAALGFLVTLLAVIGLTVFAEPQHHHEVGGKHREDHRPIPGAHARRWGVQDARAMAQRASARAAQLSKGRVNVPARPPAARRSG